VYVYVALIPKTTIDAFIVVPRMVSSSDSDSVERRPGLSARCSRSDDEPTSCVRDRGTR
jgi:hypothetical protein